MDLKQRIFRNSSLEMASKITGILAGIFLSPYLIRHLTADIYGLWVLIGSVVGYFGFTDFGVRAATGRQIAFYRGREDTEMVNKTINTSLGLLGGSGLIVTLVTVLLAPFFASAFHIGPNVSNVGSAVFMCGFAVAVGLPLTVFEGCLAGYERYDLINICEIFTTIGRVGLTVWLLEKGQGILALALINLGLTVANGGLKLVLSKWVFPPLHLAAKNFARSLARDTYATSIWFLILAVSIRISFFTDNIVIGYFLGTAPVAIYSIAGRLAQYSLTAVAAFNQVLMPISAGIHAQADLVKQRRLLLLGTRASFAAAIFTATIFLAYGEQIVRVWIKQGFEPAAIHQAGLVLAILTIPLITSSSQMTTLVVLQGVAKHKTLSLIYLTEALANLVVSLLLVKPLGILGVALGTALTSTFSSLIAQPVYVCRVLSLRLPEYYRKAFLPVLLGTAPLVALIVSVRYVWLPQHFFSMAAFCIASAALYFAVVYLIFFTSRATNRVGFSDDAAQVLRPAPQVSARKFEASPTTTVLRFVCPHCLGDMTESTAALSCRACGQTFPLTHGVPDLSVKTDYYFGEFPQPTMQSIVETATREGSAKAFQDALQDKPEDWRRYFLHYATDEARAAWQYLLDLPENATALDVGCGWGNLSVSLARNFKTVYAMDLVPERAMMASIRAREAGLQNVCALVGGNTAHLPFPDASLDLVILNGVLEWVPVSFPQFADPAEAQLHVLREIARVLKPNGQVYIGIENRTGLMYFFGRPDEHTKLPFATLLPRPLANQYAQSKLGEPYRTYTYTWRGYRKLLRRAGFAHAWFYNPYPDYREFERLIDLSHSSDLADALEPTSFAGRAALQVFKRANLLRELSSSFSIVGSKRDGTTRFADRVLHELGMSADTRFFLHVTRTATVLLCTPEVVVRLPMTERSALRARKAFANLAAVYAYAPVRDRIPKPLAEGEIQGQPYFAQTFIPGRGGHKLLAHGAQQDRILGEATRFVTDLHRGTAQTSVADDQWLETHWDERIDIIGSLGCDLQALKESCRHDLLGHQVLCVVSHNDFTLQNTVFDSETHQLCGVLDWDLTVLDGWPVQDMLHLFAAREYGTRVATLNQALLALLERLQHAGLERDLFDQYLASVKVDPIQVRWAVNAFLLLNICDKYRYGDQKVAPLLANLPEDLAQARRLTDTWLSRKERSS